MDVRHNGLLVMVSGLGRQKLDLGERIKPIKAEGVVLKGEIEREQWLALRPRMIELTTLTRTHTKQCAERRRRLVGSAQAAEYVTA